MCFLYRWVIRWLERWIQRAWLVIGTMLLVPCTYFVLDSPQATYGYEWLLIPTYLYMYASSMMIPEVTIFRWKAAFVILISLVLYALTDVDKILLIQLMVPALLWYGLSHLKAISIRLNALNLGFQAIGIYMA